MDALQDVLALLDTRSHLSAGLVAGGEWALRFRPPPGVKFNAVRRGNCLLEVDGAAEPLELSSGDCYLLTRPSGFVLRSAAGVPATDAEPVFARARDGMARTGVGDEVLLLGGSFSFGSRAQELLLDGLPPVIHVPAGTPQAETVEWALHEIGQELRQSAAGSTLVAEHLA
ncbi:cupin domain-containing protein, partial [Streptomyces zhihengii]|uniref:cupin domain-containing protein n=1 Tax=Streptomyces zhihengii TaxID=1818004 RepID=UPI0033B99FAA